MIAPGAVPTATEYAPLPHLRPPTVSSESNQTPGKLDTERDQVRVILMRVLGRDGGVGRVRSVSSVERSRLAAKYEPAERGVDRLSPLAADSSDAGVLDLMSPRAIQEDAHLPP